MSDTASKRPQQTPDAIRVLVAEDNPLNQRLARCYFDEIGCSLDIADDGIDAIRLFQINRYDLVFLDCQMPNLDGFGTARRIREFERGRAKRTPVPIVALTARAEEKDHQECLAAGMDEWLTKPFTMEELKETVARLTGAKLPTNHNVNDLGMESPANAVDTTVDTATLKALRALNTPENPTIFSDLIETYLASAATLLATMAEAAKSGDAEKMSTAAHTLRSSSANIGAIELSGIFYNLEKRGRHQPCGARSDLCRRAEEEFDRVRMILEAELQKSQ